MASSDCATKWDVAAVGDDVRAVKRDIERLSQRVSTLATSQQHRADLSLDLLLLLPGVALASLMLAIAVSRAAS